MKQDDRQPSSATDWWVFRGLSEAERASRDGPVSAAKTAEDLNATVRKLLHPTETPPWRRFDKESRDAERGADMILDDDVIQHVNAAIRLRRPLLVTGPAGTGKTSLCYAIARELRLMPVLRWPITSRTELRDGLYSYDAVARLQETQRYFNAKRRTSEGDGAEAGADGDRDREPSEAPGIESYLKLGPLGSAFAGYADESLASYPRVLLIDEIDKSDIDLPNDLLHIFEDGFFEIDELKRDGAPSHRIATADEDGAEVEIEQGRVQCRAFPIVVMTSNSERDFPGPFKRRCIQLEMRRPTVKRLTEIVERKLGHWDATAYAQYRETIERIIAAFDKAGKTRDLAVDQLLQVIVLRMRHIDPFEGVDPKETDQHKPLMQALWQSLRESQG